MQVGSLKRPLEAPETVTGAADLEWGRGGPWPGLGGFPMRPVFSGSGAGVSLGWVGLAGPEQETVFFLLLTTYIEHSY